MDKYKIRNNRAFVLLTKYLLVIIRQLNEKNILMNIEKSNLGYDDILIEEASKEIIDLISIFLGNSFLNLRRIGGVILFIHVFLLIIDCYSHLVILF